MPVIKLHMSKLATGVQRNYRSYVFLNKQALKYQNIIKIEEMKNKLIKQRIKFTENNRKYIYDVEHNLPNVFGQSLQCAVDVWRTRTKDFSLQSLIDYIDSKNQDVIIKENK